MRGSFRDHHLHLSIVPNKNIKSYLSCPKIPEKPSGFSAEDPRIGPIVSKIQLFSPSEVEGIGAFGQPTLHSMISLKRDTAPSKEHFFLWMLILFSIL
jgi:hypothetical protein